jgi:hypothetical protein
MRQHRQRQQEQQERVLQLELELLSLVLLLWVLQQEGQAAMRQLSQEARHMVV